MKRITAILLSCVLVLAGCNPSVTSEKDQMSIQNDTVLEKQNELNLSDTEKEEELKTNTDESVQMSFQGLDDAKLLTYVKNTVYSELIDTLDSDDYFVENISAAYLSQEYVNDLDYNSKTNMFFGYSLDELEEEFQGKRYIFTLGDDGKTAVKELEEVYDDTYDQVVKNIAIGSGVILVCVTVSVATAGTAPAVSVVFAASAETSAEFALESSILSFVAASLVRGYQTQDFDQAMKAGILSASNGFKCGAIFGGVYGGIAEGFALKGGTLTGLKMNEAAVIQRESKWPLDAIKSIHSIDEYEIYKNAELVPMQLTDNTWTFVS